jgi:hypothetical protein
MTAPQLRATPEFGPSYDDPSEDALFELLEDLDAGEGTWLIVERVSDATGQSYAQALRREDGHYQVEHREGGPDSHVKTSVGDVRAAHQLMVGWAFQLPEWDSEHEWLPVRT